MLFVNEIPHLKRNRLRSYLPINSKRKTKGTVIFLNNKSIDSSIKFMHNKFIYHNNKFFYYYIDFLYKGKLYKSMYRKNIKKERKKLYKKVRDSNPIIRTVNTFEQVNQNNVYFDLFKYNEIYFNQTKKLTYRLKVKKYIDYLKSIINNEKFKDYKQKIILIDVNDWLENDNEINKIKPKLNNPIYILMYSMYKFFDKFKELGDINIIFYTDNLSLRVNPSECDEKSYQLFKREIKKISSKIEINENDKDIEDDEKFEDSVIDRINTIINDKKEDYENISKKDLSNKIQNENDKDIEDDVKKYDVINDKDIEDDVKKYDVINDIVNNMKDTYKFTGDSDNEIDDEDDEKFEDIVIDRINTIINDKKEDYENISKKDLSNKIQNELINDLDMLKQIKNLNQDKLTGRTTSSLKRDEELRKKQKELKINNITIEELNIDNDLFIPSEDISHKVATINENITKVKYPKFEETYNQKLFTKDLTNTIKFLNEKSIPVYIRNVKKEDTSDELNLKETYTFELEDSNRVRHKLKFDMPIFIDDKFMYLNGNKKIIIKQLMMKPVVKTGPDVVQICSNYNKIFMRRYGNKASSKIEKFKKLLSEQKQGIKVKYGNNITINSKFKSVFEYDELSKIFTSISLNKHEFIFNQDEIQKKLLNINKKIENENFCVGFYSNGEPILMDIDSQKMLNTDIDLIDYILSLADKNIIEEFNDISSGKKFMYTRAKIMSKQVPLILFLGYLEGLTTVLKKAGIEHYFSDTRPKIDNNNKGVIQFADGYLVFNKYPFENSLLLNAFSDIPTKSFNYEEFDDKDTYLTIFDILFNSRIIGNAFDNFYDFMIDPITKEVLEELNYPTDLVSLLLFANSLLSDNSYIKENNMNLYRIRSNELVNAYLYKAVADAYIKYRMTANNNNPVKISIPRDIVIKEILKAQTIEDYSTLNPIVELEKSRAITPKGLSGMNVPEAYTQEKRSYDKTMLGLLAMSTSPDANCGVIRDMVLEPKIVSPRGFIEINDDRINTLKDVNLFSPAELLSPLGVTRDDSIRTAMATKQSKHIIPITKSSPVLISNGAEQVIQYHLSNDFVIKAKDDGEVKDIKEDIGIVLIEYKDGSKQAIDINPKVVKNGAGGFFLSNQLDFHYKKGDKIKKNDILASDKNFFKQSKFFGNRFNIGSLQKVMCFSTYSTYEDSTFITKKLSTDMASKIVMEKPVVLGKNANVDYIVKIGDKVQVGDELIKFELSFEEDTLNKFLANIGDTLKEEIKTLGKTQIKSKYSGVIEDIKIYSTVELDELSPSLKKIVSNYYTKINKKRKVIEDFSKSNLSKLNLENTNNVYKAGILLNEPTTKVETKDGKVKGHEVGEGVLIEFYIKYDDIMGVGDKITFFTALKSIIGEVIPEGQEPYSEFRPDEEVSSVIAPGAVLARMTPSILLTMFGNKVLIELKRKLYEIYSGKPWKPVQENMIEKTDDEILLETVTEIYRDRNINGDLTYYTKKNISKGDTICSIRNGNKLSIFGEYIKSSKNPNCKLIDNFIISIREINIGEELTISESDYKKLNNY